MLIYAYTNFNTTRLVSWTMLRESLYAYHPSSTPKIAPNPQHATLKRRLLMLQKSMYAWQAQKSCGKGGWKSGNGESRYPGEEILEAKGDAECLAIRVQLLCCCNLNFEISFCLASAGLCMPQQNFVHASYCFFKERRLQDAQVYWEGVSKVDVDFQFLDLLHQSFVLKATRWHLDRYDKSW